MLRKLLKTVMRIPYHADKRPAYVEYDEGEFVEYLMVYLGNGITFMIFLEAEIDAKVVLVYGHNGTSPMRTVVKFELNNPKSIEKISESIHNYYNGFWKLKS